MTEDGAGQLRCTFSGPVPPGENLIVTGFRAICSARGAVQVPSLDVTVTCDIPACAGSREQRRGPRRRRPSRGARPRWRLHRRRDRRADDDRGTSGQHHGGGPRRTRGRLRRRAWPRLRRRRSVARRGPARDRHAATLVADQDGACGPARARVAAGRHLQRAAHGAAAPGRRDRSARRLARSLLRSAAPAVSPVAGTRAWPRSSRSTRPA